jgi:hypothetical protein
VVGITEKIRTTHYSCGCIRPDTVVTLTVVVVYHQSEAIYSNRDSTDKQNSTTKTTSSLLSSNWNATTSSSYLIDYNIAVTSLYLRKQARYFSPRGRYPQHIKQLRNNFMSIIMKVLQISLVVTTLMLSATTDAFVPFSRGINQNHHHLASPPTTVLFSEQEGTTTASKLSSSNGGGFDLDTAVFCGGLAFDAYSEPPQDSTRWEKGVSRSHHG